MCNVTICVFIVHTDIWATAPLSWICSKLPRNWQSNKNICEIFFLCGGGVVWRQRQDRTHHKRGREMVTVGWMPIGIWLLSKAYYLNLSHCNVSLTNEQRMKGTVQLEQNIIQRISYEWARYRKNCDEAGHVKWVCDYPGKNYDVQSQKATELLFHCQGHPS